MAGLIAVNCTQNNAGAKRPARIICCIFISEIKLTMHYTIELNQETDGRWIADVIDLPGVLTYGHTREEAIAKAQALALRVEADKLECGEYFV